MSKKEFEEKEFEEKASEMDSKLQISWRKELQFFLAEEDSEYKELENELIGLGQDLEKESKECIIYRDYSQLYENKKISSTVVLNSERLFSLCWAIVDHFNNNSAEKNSRLLTILFQGLNSILNRYLQYAETPKILFSLDGYSGKFTYPIFLLKDTGLSCREGRLTSDMGLPVKDYPLANIKFSDLNLIINSQGKNIPYNHFCNFFIHSFQRCIRVFKSEEAVENLKYHYNTVQIMLSDVFIPPRLPSAIVFLFLLNESFRSAKEHILAEEKEFFKGLLSFLPLFHIELIYSYSTTPAFCFFEGIDNDENENENGYKISTKALRDLSFVAYRRHADSYDQQKKNLMHKTF